jgi:predicted TIM-barrel fold metal-dependent hydrolase
VSEIFNDFREIDYPIIDADAHVQEPPDLWQSRAPARFKDRAPRVERTEHGDLWLFDAGKARQPVGLTACAGLSFLDFRPAGHRYDAIRPGMYEPRARLKDMDIDKIYAQVLYPSVTLTGAKTYTDDRELQKFCVRAYNEWMTEFCANSGGRLIGLGIVPTTGLDDAVTELEWMIKNGLRGAIISRMPSGDYDPRPEDARFFGLAQEADVPVHVHIGSFLRLSPSEAQKGPAFDELTFLGRAGGTKAGANTLPVTCDLIFSGLWDQFTRLKIVLVEANVGWIPTLLEQTDDMYLRYRWFTKAVDKMRDMPSEIFHRHFWATFMIDTVGMQLRYRMNIDHLMWSSDYPHTGTDWPNSRVTLDRLFRGIPKVEVRKMLHDNVKALYRLDHIPDTL